MEQRTQASGPAPHHTVGLAGRLNREWTQQVAHTLCPQAWSATPALAELVTLQDVLDQCRPEQTAQTKDAVLHALITHAKAGCALAQRTLVQTMLNKIVRLSKTAGARGIDGPLSYTLTAFLGVVDAYPLHQRTSVAGTLALNTLHSLPAAPQVHEHPQPDDHLVDLTHHSSWHSLAQEGHTDRDEQLIVKALTWALDQRILTEVDVRILAHRYLVDDGQLRSIAEVAERLDLTPGYVRKRHAAALRRLASSVLLRT